MLVDVHVCILAVIITIRRYVRYKLHRLRQFSEPTSMGKFRSMITNIILAVSYASIQSLITISLVQLFNITHVSEIMNPFGIKITDE